MTNTCLSAIRRFSGLSAVFLLLQTIGLLRCADNLNPLLHQLTLQLSVSDSVILIRDTITLRCRTSSEIHSDARFVWYVDSPYAPDTTASGILTRVFSVRDTGERLIVVEAIDSRGSISWPESLYVTVGYRQPVARIRGEGTAFAGTASAIAIVPSRVYTPLVRSEWRFDSTELWKATLDSTFLLPWSIADTGTHRLLARVVDEDGIASLPDTLLIRVTYRRPILKRFADTVVKVNTGLTVHFATEDGNSSVAQYRYSIDTRGKAIVTADSMVTVHWGVADSGLRRIAVTAISGDGIASEPETLSVAVKYSRPQATLRADTVAAINDTVLFTAQTSDADGSVDLFRWSIDGGQWITTDTAVLGWTFGTNYASRHTVRLVAVDDDGLLSDTALISVRVSLLAPSVRLHGSDTAIFANQRLLLRAAAYDSNGTISAWRWTVDGRLAGQPPGNDSLSVVWKATEAGIHRVAVTVADDDNLESAPDTIRVTVMPGVPTVTAMRDTTVSSLDTLDVTCTAADVNGTVLRYFWNTGGAGWTDSTSLPVLRLRYDGRDRVSVVVGARDNDGFVATDTIVVLFNRPPEPITVRIPSVNDTFVYTPSVTRCTVSFSFTAPDPDQDSVSFTLQWGATPQSLVPLYQGNDTTAEVLVTRPGRYYWRIIARDAWGHTRTNTGNCTVIKEHRICFIGHSIVVGWGDSDHKGGFRAGILDSLRKQLGPYERLKPVGPCTTNFMPGSLRADDSCLAVAGTSAREIFLMLTISHSQLSADVWVLMIGVNENYSYNESRYTVKLIDAMLSRNPQSRIYALNGIRLPDSYFTANYYCPIFNSIVADSVAARKARGSYVTLVDAASALNGPGGTFNQANFDDDVHPNPVGYNRLVKSIVSAMRTSNPPVLP